MRTGHHHRPDTLIQGWTQPLQSLLYWRLPFSPRKNVHSRRHFLLRLISRPAPGDSSAGRACPGFSATRTPVSRPPAAPGWKAFLRRDPARLGLGFLQFLTTVAVIDDPVNHAVIILQGYLRCVQRVFRFHGDRHDLSVDTGK